MWVHCFYVDVTIRARDFLRVWNSIIHNQWHRQQIESGGLNLSKTLTSKIWNKKCITAKEGGGLAPPPRFRRPHDNKRLILNVYLEDTSSIAIIILKENQIKIPISIKKKRKKNTNKLNQEMHYTPLFLFLNHRYFTQMSLIFNLYC